MPADQQQFFSSTHYFEIFGDPLPGLPTRAALDTFLERVTSISAADSFAPVIPISATIISQDDTFWSVEEDDSTFFGGIGNDVFFVTQSGGSDTYDGGIGRDSIWYMEQVRLDLENPDRNTNAAAGDTFESIEVFLGSQGGADNISGDGGHNTLVGDFHTSETTGREAVEGLENVYYQNTPDVDLSQTGDWLFGRAGDDVLVGGFGHDNLNGGTGADSLFGGAWVDTARYTGGSAIVIDLSDTTKSTGEAFGDV